MDAVAHKTCGPDKRRNEISQRKQENVTKKLIVIEHDNRSDKAYGHAQSESQHEQCPPPCRPASRQQRHQCPAQAEGQKQSCVSPATSIANGPRPAQLMAA